MPEINRQHRDIQCADDVRLMARLRRFDQEFTAYGTAEWRQDQGVRYLATSNLNKLYAYIQNQKINNSFFTPVISFSKRTPMPSGMEEVLQLVAKYSILSNLKSAYESVNFWDYMIPVFEKGGNDLAYDILEGYRKEIDGYFRDRELQIFSGLVRYAYEAKILSERSLTRFLNWHGDACREIENVPVAGDKFKRTFYGFIVFDDVDRSAMHIIFDAEKTEIYSKHYKMILDGKVVGPILQRTFFFHQFSQLQEIRAFFNEWLIEDCEKIFLLLNSIRKLPGVIDRSMLEVATEKCSESKDAIDAIHYYINIINFI